MEVFEIRLESIDSTNTYAKQHFAEFPKDKLTCILAEEQTGGRGRFDRPWHSPRGQNLYVTFAFKLSSTRHLGCLAQIMSLSFAQVLLKEGLKPNVKWPNDILLHDKKVSGVLCETEIEQQDVSLFLGIGINVNMDAEQFGAIDQPATSLLAETGHDWDRDALLKQLTEQFLSDLELFKKSGFEPFYELFDKLMALKGKKVRCFDGQKEWSGVCDSITQDGQLNLRLPDGTMHTIAAGEVKSGSL